MTKRNTEKNTIYNIIKSIAGIIFPLITFPYISRVLGAENVGKINFGNSVISYFSLIATLGISSYAIRECSKRKDNKEELSQFASQIYSINIITTFVAYAALAITLIFAKSLENYRTLIMIQSTTILFTTLGADWINTAFEDFKYITVRTVITQIISIICMFIFVRNPDEYIIYAIISVLAGCGGNIMNIIYRRKFCKMKFTFNMEIKKHIVPIMLLFSMILAQIIYCNSDITILGLVKGDYEVGLYSVSVKIYNIVNSLVASISIVVMPKLSQAFAENDFKSVNSNVKYALQFIVTLGLPCIAGLNLLTKQLIICVAGEEYAGASLSLHILTISIAASFIGGWIGNITMLPAGKESICLRAGIVSALLNIILNLIFIPIWGLNAAAGTTAISEIVGVIILLPKMDKRIKIDNVWNIIKSPIVGSIAIIAFSLIMKSLITNIWLLIGITIAGSAIIYFAILIIMKNEFVNGFVEQVIIKKYGDRQDDF